jgi:hypothetical protein
MDNMLNEIPRLPKATADFEANGAAVSPQQSGDLADGLSGFIVLTPQGSNDGVLIGAGLKNCREMSTL